MKRLGLYVIVSVMLFGVFGGFVIPNKGYAAGTKNNGDQCTTASDCKSVFCDSSGKCDFPATGRHEGQPCASDSQCSSNVCAKNGGFPACAAPGSNSVLVGGTCAVNTDCRSAVCGSSKMCVASAYPGDQCTANNECLSNNCVSGKCGVATDQNAAYPSTGGVADPSDLPTGCEMGIFGPKAPIMCVNSLIGWLIKNTLLEVAGFLVWVSANMLNYAIQIGILDFKSWAPDTLYPIWIIVRQIVSLFIVFAGLWLGFMYIVGKDEKFEKYIPWVVIFALFVNFSYPLARTAVDLSNIVSLNIYASAVGNDALQAEIGDEHTAGGLIMNSLGLQGLVMSATGDKKATMSNVGIVGKIDGIPGALMAVVFVLYAAYIFFMVTALIVVRTAVLVFLIVASPLLLVDSVVPRLGDVAEKLRRIFVEQLAVGPVFMIMLALTLKFLDVFSSGPMKSASAAGNSTVTTFFNILLMLIMLHIMITVTKKAAGSIGEAATSAMGKVGGFATGAALGVATGGAGLLARGSIGRGAAALRDSEWVRNNQHKGLGRHAYNMSNSVAKSSFDARNSSIVQTGAGRLGLGKGMGAGSDSNYEKALDAKIQDRKARYGRIKTENADGTINQAGALAKQNFYTKQGMIGEGKFSKAFGVIQNKNKVGEALFAVDKEVAQKQDKTLESYDKRTGETKQNYFRAEQDQAMKNQMLEHDKAQAEMGKTEQGQPIKNQPLEHDKPQAEMGGGDPSKGANVESLKSEARAKNSVKDESIAPATFVAPAVDRDHPQTSPSSGTNIITPPNTNPLIAANDANHNPNPPKTPSSSFPADLKPQKEEHHDLKNENMFPEAA